MSDKFLVRSLFANDSAFEAFYEDSMIGIGVVDRDGIFLDINEAFTDFLGYSRGEVVGRSWQSFTHPSDILPDEINVKLSAETGEPYRMTKRYLHKSGKYVTAVLRVVPLTHQLREIFISSIVPREEVEGIIKKTDKETGETIQAVDYSIWRFVTNNKKEIFILIFAYLILSALTGQFDQVVNQLNSLFPGK